MGDLRMASAYTQENSWEGLDIVTNKNIEKLYQPKTISSTTLHNNSKGIVKNEKGIDEIAF